jgi:hypothetical protein
MKKNNIIFKNKLNFSELDNFHQKEMTYGQKTDFSVLYNDLYSGLRRFPSLHMFSCKSIY